MHAQVITLSCGDKIIMKLADACAGHHAIAW